jgi:two-component sensor histidine kinase
MIMREKAAALGSFARVKVWRERDLVLVPIAGDKPDIPEKLIEKWQKIVDLVASIMGVPSGLVTRLTEDSLEIVVASRTAGNPYARGDRDRLGIGMFCETVAGKRRELRVDDVSTDEYWAKNPHSGLGMKAYIGVPIEWEDGELFGTFCMLTDKANAYEDRFLELLGQFKDIIESDLRYIALKSELEQRLSAREMELREIHHRLKNQLNILVSYISLQLQVGVGEDAKGALRDVQHRILAISMVHEQIYCSSGVEAPALDVYLPRLCGFILEDLVRDDIGMEYAIDPVSLPMDKEVSIAIIVSELLTNSIKHAFRGSLPGTISIEVRRRGEGALDMVYRDSGVGLPAGFDPRASNTLGMLIIGALVRQLGGTMKAESDGGAKFSFALEP